MGWKLCSYSVSGYKLYKADIRTCIFMFCIMLSFALLFSVSGFAQTLPDVGSELQQQQQREKFNHLPDRIPEDKVTREQQQEPVTDKVRVFVKQFRFVGDITVFSQQELKQLVAPFVNRNSSLADIQAAVDAVTQAYQARGYMLGRGVLPPQDITEGVITVEIHEGKIDSSPDGVQINGRDLRVKETRLRDIFTHTVKPGGVLKGQALERAVLLISDLPGVNASANLEKGAQPGTTRIVLDVTESPVLQPTMAFDNSGSRLTGEDRLTLDLDVNDPFGYGEQFSVSGQKSAGAGDFRYVTLEASAPFGDNGLRLKGSLKKLEYTAGKEFASLNAKGSATQWALDGHYPVIRQRLTNLHANFGAERKTLVDSSLGNTTNHRVIMNLKAGLTASHVDRLLEGGYTVANLTGYLGNADLQGNSAGFAADQGSSGANTHGDFQKLTFDVRRIQRTSDDFYVLADVSGQIASANLTSSEKFQLGGVGGVRAYPGGEGAGDNGIRASIEGRYVLITGTSVGDVRVSAFYDWGRVQQFKRPDNLGLVTPNTYSLSGYGLGLNIGLPDTYNMDLIWARRNGDNPARDQTTGNDSDGSLDKDRFWLSVSVTF